MWTLRSSLLLTTAAIQSPVPELCSHSQTALAWVDTKAHRLFACEEKSVARSYDVRLGRQGTTLIHV
jgi:hypothetical protein